MMKVDPRRLLDLLSVARHGSFSGAAEAMRVSQPALSQSIALLERELGTRLIDRTSQGAKLNAFGEVMAFHGQALESLLDNAREEMRLRLQGIEGPISIGITPVTAVGIVPRALDRILSHTPDISVSIFEGLDATIIEMLRSRKLDVVVSRMRGTAFYPDVEEEVLIPADWALIAAPSHPLATQKAIRLSELGKVNWVVPAGGSAFRHNMELLFTAAGVPWPSTGVSTNSILTIKSIVMNTDCVTIMSPSLVEVEREAGKLCCIPLEDAIPLQSVAMMWRKKDPLSPIAARLVAALRELARTWQ